MDARKKKTISSTSKPTCPYPARPNRYSRFGWNANSQSCYTREDNALLHKIQDEYQKKLPNNNGKPYFATEQETAWFNNWKCDRPTLAGKAISYEDKSFTLPNRIAKDTKAFPLWDFSERMAKQIANWQAERATNSEPDAINDPAMLAFEELREWFFNVLAEKECKPEDLQLITQRQSYIVKLINLLPYFDQDYYHLHEIKSELDKARNIVLATIANRELPELLSVWIRDAKSWENTLGTVLHFLGINEVVDDNFSSACLESSDVICKNSPVRKIFDAAKAAALETPPSESVAHYQEQNSLYKFSQNDDGTILTELRTEAVNAVNFATFLTESDKKNYIEALAILQALTNVRKTLEEFQNVQPSIGTYEFAKSFLEDTTELANNFNALMTKTTSLLNGLIHKTDNGLGQILTDNPNQRKNPNFHFKNNMGKLQTRVVGDTTLDGHLDTYSKSAINSMNNFIEKMDELVADLNSGKALVDIRRKTRKLSIRLKTLNNMLSAINNNKKLIIDMNLSDNCLDMPLTEECAEKELLLTTIDNESVVESTTETVNDTKQPHTPDRLEKIIATATHSAGYGVMRGATNVMGNALQSHGYSQRAANITSQLAYYSMYFASRFYEHYEPMPCQEPTQATLDAMQQAAIETGQVWILSTVMNQVGNYLESAGNELEKGNWSYLGTGLKKLGSLAQFGMFAVAATTSDPVDVVVGFAAGTAAEVVTERVGNAMFAR